VPDSQGVWVYAVANRVDEAALRGLTGVSGEPVYPLTAAGLTAAAGAVPLAEFGDEALRRNLEDLAWLETVARRHHEVIESVAHGIPVVPMRLATVYHSDEGVIAMLGSRHDDLAAALARVSGRDEWGVKVYAARRQASAPADPEGTPPASPGAAYLSRRKSELSASEEARRSAAASAEEIHAVLSGLAAGSLLRPPQAPQLSGQTGQMILNSAYLVDAEGADRLREAVESLASGHRGVRIELTGPWPPYSFAAIEHTEHAYGAAT
jgi:Gas vesicle synthesis protein GvpL/GvpF